MVDIELSILIMKCIFAVSAVIILVVLFHNPYIIKIVNIRVHKKIQQI